MEVQPVQIIPDGYDPSNQNVNWANIVPDFQLPDGKIFVQRKGSAWSKERLYSKGVTHLAHNDFGDVPIGEVIALSNAGKTYHAVPITPELFGIGATGPNEWVGNYPDSYNRLYFPNGLPDYNQGFQYGSNTDVAHALIIGETLENNHYTNPMGDHWKGYYDAKAPRLQAKYGNNWRMSHDYLFSSMAPYFRDNSSDALKAFSRNPSTVPKWGWYHGGALEKCNLTTTPVYIGAPDTYGDVLYGLAYDCQWTKRQGMYHVSVPTPTHEWRPNNLNAHVMPEGTLYKYDKHPVCASLATGIAVVSFVFGDGVVPWGHSTHIAAGEKTWSEYWTRQFANDSFWIANGENSQRNWETWPHLINNDTYTVSTWTGNEDIWSFAAYAYAATFGQVHGGDRSWCQYKIGSGGSWYTPVNQYEDDIVNAGKNKMPIFLQEVKNGKMAYCYINPGASNTKQTIYFTGPSGQQFSFEAVGDMPKMGLVNL